MNLSDESTCRESSGVSDSKTPVTADERLSSKSTVYSIFGLRPQSLEEPNEQRFSSDVLVQSQERGKNDQEASLPVTRQAAAAGCGAQSCDSIATVPQLTGTSLQSRNSEPGLSNPKEAANSFEPASSSSSLSSSSAPYAKPLDTSCAPAPTGIFQTRHAQLKLDRGELWKLRSVFEAHDPQHRGLELPDFYELVHEYFPQASLNDVAFIFRLFDVEQNGRLSLRDFMCGYAIICHATAEERLRLCFAMVDRDACGHLDERQVAQALHLLSSYADLLVQFSSVGDHENTGDHDVDADALLEMARLMVETATKERLKGTLGSARQSRSVCPIATEHAESEVNTHKIAFDEFLEIALRNPHIQHWLADIGSAVGAVHPSLRDQKEVEMIVLEIERLGFIRTEACANAAALPLESRPSTSEASMASSAPVARSLSSSLEETAPSSQEYLQLIHRGRSRESSQRGGSLYLSQSFSTVHLAEQGGQRQLSLPQTPELHQNEARASIPRLHEFSDAELRFGSSPMRMERRYGSFLRASRSVLSHERASAPDSPPVTRNAGEGRALATVADMNEEDQANLDNDGEQSLQEHPSKRLEEHPELLSNEPAAPTTMTTTTSAENLRSSDQAAIAKMTSFLLHSPFVIEYTALRFERKIGEGSFSEVWSGEWLHLPVAIKVFKRFDPSMTGTWPMLRDAGASLTGTYEPPGIDDQTVSTAAASAKTATRPECSTAATIDHGLASSSSSDSESSVEAMTFETDVQGHSAGARLDEALFAADAAAGLSMYGIDKSQTHYNGQQQQQQQRKHPRPGMHLLDETPRRLDEFNLVSFVREVELLSQLRHPNVLLYMGATADPRKPLCIVSELFPGGSVHDLLFKRRKRLSKHQKLRIAIAVARGMLYLHSCKPQILHRDLKSSNVLVDESLNRIAICDFGLSALRRAGAGESSNYGSACDADTMGTPYTLAPEVMGGEPYTDKADVYSYSIVLWELLTRKKPFENLMPVQLMYKVYAQNARPPLGEVYAEFQALLSRCWERDPQSRPDFGTILDILEDISLELATNAEDASGSSSDDDTDNTGVGGGSGSSGGGNVGADAHERAAAPSQTKQLQLMNAVVQNDLARVKRLLERGVSPCFCDYDRRTPLHVAAAEGFVDIAVCLLEHGAEVNARDRWGSTPLSEAIRFRHEHCAQVLRDQYGGRIFDQKSHFELIDAVARGDIAAVRSFIGEGVDVRQADYDRRTALHLAAAEGYTQVAKLLVEAGADVMATDRWGSTPLQEAIRFKHPETAVYIESVMGAQLRQRARGLRRDIGGSSSNGAASPQRSLLRTNTPESDQFGRGRSSPAPQSPGNVDYYGD
jgi:serine/threonine protein kinase/ankyrin repeat protein